MKSNAWTLKPIQKRWKAKSAQSLLESIFLLPLLLITLATLTRFLVISVEEKQKEGYLYRFAREAFSRSVHHDKPSIEVQNFKTLTGVLTFRRETKGHRVSVQDITQRIPQDSNGDLGSGEGFYLEK